MCSNKTLYAPSPLPATAPQKRRHGESMDFQQIRFSTDCLKMMSNRLDQPIYLTLQHIESKGLMPELYKMAKSSSRPSTVKAVNRLQKLMAE